MSGPGDADGPPRASTAGLSLTGLLGGAGIVPQTLPQLETTRGFLVPGLVEVALADLLRGRIGGSQASVVPRDVDTLLMSQDSLLMLLSGPTSDLSPLVAVGVVDGFWSCGRSIRLAHTLLYVTTEEIHSLKPGFLFKTAGSPPGSGYINQQVVRAPREPRAGDVYIYRSDRREDLPNTPGGIKESSVRSPEDPVRDPPWDQGGAP